ncbi:N-acetylmuramoyl-L-alanine amidase [Paenibacillus sp. yr247]|uniref:N-acetylmuramoyl-L-alanine amidase n=1 Tax=Paenibacillus sp. yr247 TaxID=1761880 RepID=UPI00088EF7C8|nr:peptidoglycan recognition family protein [Paenibacillus sp. yr247]SDO22016.1 N-acetylmuramoyl-L-alanine amidase [Paenibacillus sp. yr247]
MHRHFRIKRFIVPLALTGLLFGTVSFSPVSSLWANQTMSVNAAAIQSDSLQEAFTAAAKEFGVSESILLSVSYNLTRWEHHNGEPSTSGGYGIMHLTDYEQGDLEESKGTAEPLNSLTGVTQDPGLHTLLAAAQLLQLNPDVLKSDPTQNIRGAAALLAQYAKETTGTVPSNPEDWYGAVVKYSGSTEASTALDFANLVYDTINQGAERQTTNGQAVRLSAQPLKHNDSTANSLQLQTRKQSDADCPNSISCHFVPAAYQQHSAAPGDYSNYDLADRPNFGPEIRYILIHDTEVSYDGTINIFQNPFSYVAAHYVVRSSDGDVTQMVNNKDVGWHAGNWYFNMHSIGVEHEGFAMEGASWYSEQLYRSSASLVKYLANKYNVPIDRAHIFGHEEVPGLSPSRQKSMHRDPGPFWDWEHYMELMGAPIHPSGGSQKLVTIKPHFQTNQPLLSDAPSQPSDFVYLYSSPSFEAPLLDDAATLGENKMNTLNWGDKAVTGQTFYLADRQGDWDAIWYGGQKAWFYDPNARNTVKSTGLIIKPKEGKATIPVYGGAYPEVSAYPSGIGPYILSPLQYKIQQGQEYVAFEKVKGDYYNAKVFTYDPYHDSKEVIGNEEYYRIQFNHRFAFVKASDVNIDTN